MVRIAIVEDEQNYALQVQRYIDQFSKEYNVELWSTLFSDGDEILENYKSSFDIIFLDIQMPFMDGMTTAQEIRKLDTEVVIIFITNLNQYAIRGYAVEALGYLLKPITYFTFSQQLQRALSRIKKRMRQYITISIKGGARKIDISTIYYVESQGHSLIYHTATGIFTTIARISMAEEKLKCYDFYRCNKGYIVNLAHVSAVQDKFAIVGNDKVQISRARKSDFLQALTKHIGEVIR